MSSMSAASAVALTLLVCWSAAASAATDRYGRSSGYHTLKWRDVAVAKRHADCDGIDTVSVPQLTASGYVDVNKTLESDMWFAFYEAREPQAPLSRTPIVLWLQGGPGCSGAFGMLYINGPYFVCEDELTLRENPASWNRMYGYLMIEQPIGVGFSRAGRQPLPTNEVEVAADLFKAINNFYRKFPSFKDRPLIVSGESYAGKYVPSISHYILQADAQANGYLSKVKHARDIGDDVEAPVFKFGGLAIGNGWTDADTQQLVQAEIAWSMGLIDTAQRRVAEAMQQQVLEEITNKRWREARRISDAIQQYLVNCSGSSTLEDIRRNLGYDGHFITDSYLNQDHVKRHLKADPSIYWIACSPEIDQSLGPDVMRSVKKLVEDLLDFYPVLLYQGQFDAECGVASNDAWVSTMAWKGHSAFMSAPRDLWHINGRVMGYWKHHGHLTNLVIRNTGHMVPHDNPLYGQALIERWIEERVLGRAYNREFTEEEEQMMLRIRGTDEGQWAGPDTTRKGSAKAAARAQAGGSSSSSRRLKAGSGSA